MKNIVYKPQLWLFLFCLAVLHGASFTLADIYNPLENPDCITYLGIADFDFDQSPIRKYRIIVPFAASVINFLLGDLLSKLAPWTFPGDFGMSMSFLIVNNLLMALFGVLVFQFVSCYVKKPLAIFAGLLSVLTCRWTSYIAGLPWVDSLFCIVLATTLIGLKTNNFKYIIASIFIGPWAKESFIFIAPIIFFYAKVPKLKQVIYFLISGILVFSARYYIDYLSMSEASESLARDFSHFYEISNSLKRLFSFHGIYEVFSIVGFWGILLIPAIMIKNVRKNVFSGYEPFVFWFVASVVFQALLSTELARMFYLATPVLAVLWAKIIEKLLNEKRFYSHLSIN